MWNQWPQFAAAPPLPTTAPPPPPQEPAAVTAPAAPPMIGPMLPSAVASPSLPPSSLPTASTAALGAAAMPTTLGANPYSQYTAAQYAAMTPEQQFALQQHWQQWQKYQEEYARWHAQYGEQYKREMELAQKATIATPTAAAAPSYPPSYYQQAASIATSNKITGQPQLYNQPPPPQPQPPAATSNPMNYGPPPSVQQQAWQPPQQHSVYSQPPPNFGQQNINPNNSYTTTQQFQQPHFAGGKQQGGPPQHQLNPDNSQYNSRNNSGNPPPGPNSWQEASNNSRGSDNYNNNRSGNRGNAPNNISNNNWANQNTGGANEPQKNWNTSAGPANRNFNTNYADDVDVNERFDEDDVDDENFEMDNENMDADYDESSNNAPNNCNSEEFYQDGPGSSDRNRDQNNWNDGPNDRNFGQNNRGPNNNRGNNGPNNKNDFQGNRERNFGSNNRGTNNWNQSSNNRGNNNWNDGNNSRGSNNWNDGPNNRGSNNRNDRGPNNWNDGPNNRGPNNWNDGPNNRANDRSGNRTANDRSFGFNQRGSNNFNDSPNNNAPNDRNFGNNNRRNNRSNDLLNRDNSGRDSRLPDTYENNNLNNRGRSDGPNQRGGQGAVAPSGMGAPTGPVDSSRPVVCPEPVAATVQRTSVPAVTSTVSSGAATGGIRLKDLDEEMFDRQFRQWEQQFEDWKKANANHPDKAMYKRYELEFEKQRKRIAERREQMRRRKLEQMGIDPNQVPPECPQTENAVKEEADKPISTDRKRNDSIGSHQSSSSKQNQEAIQETIAENVQESEETTANQNLVGEEPTKNNTSPEKDEKKIIDETIETAATSETPQENKTTAMPLGKRKSRFDTPAQAIKIKAVQAPEVITLDDDDDGLANSEQVEDNQGNMSEIFKKVDGIPGLDLADGTFSGPTKEENTSKPEMDGDQKAIGKNQTNPSKIPSLFDIKVDKPDMTDLSDTQKAQSSTGLPDLAKTLNDPDFLKKISEAVAQAKCTDPSKGQEVDDHQSFAEWQQRKQADGQENPNVFNTDPPDNVNLSESLRDKSCSRSETADDLNSNFSAHSGSGGNRSGVGFPNNGPNNNFGPGGNNNWGPNNNNPNNWGPNDRNNCGPNGPNNWGPNGPNGPNNNFGNNGPNILGNNGRNNWGPNGPNNNFGPNGPNNNFGPNGPNNNFGPNGPNNNCGPNGPNNNFGPNGSNNNFGQNAPNNNFGPNGPNNWGPNGSNNWGPNGPNDFGSNNNFRGGNNFGPDRNFGGNGPNFGRNDGQGRNFGRNLNNFNSNDGSNRNFGRNESDFEPNDGPNSGPNNNRGRNFARDGRNFGQNSGSGGNFSRDGSDGNRRDSGWGGSNDRRDGSKNRSNSSNNSRDGSNSRSNTTKDISDADAANSPNLNTNNPFRRSEVPKVPSLGEGKQTGAWNKGPDDRDNLDYGDYYRPVQVIDYSNSIANPTTTITPKVIDYGHKPAMNDDSNAFKPLKIINYGHASKVKPPQQQPRLNAAQKRRKRKNKNQQGNQKNQKLNQQQRQQQQQQKQTQVAQNVSTGPHGQKDSQEQNKFDDAEKEQDDLEEISDFEDMPEEPTSPPPPPPPMFSSSGTFTTFTTQGVPSSIFPSTSDANENLPKMSATHVQMSIPTEENNNTISIDEILMKPGRQTRPKRICMILRGPPGSGKSHVAKLIKEKEKEMGGSNPRILSIDDYFLIENDYEEKCPKTGKKIPKKEILYEYDKDMEEKYMEYLIKAFKKSVADNFYDFIVIDCNNNSLRSLNEFYCHSKDSGFVPYIIDLFCDLETCLERNAHERTEKDIKDIINSWKPTPGHYIKLDISSLLQNIVEMEDAEDMVVDDNSVSENAIDSNMTAANEQNEADDNENEGADDIYSDDNVNDNDEDSNDSAGNCGFLESKWETDTTTENLARLDGTSKLSTKRKPTMEEYLQMDEWEPPTNTKGKKRVRWADIEEKRKQEKMRAVGFVVGQTDWKRMMDPNAAKRALNKTKYIERVNKRR